MCSCKVSRGNQLLCGYVLLLQRQLHELFQRLRQGFYQVLVEEGSEKEVYCGGGIEAPLDS